MNPLDQKTFKRVIEMYKSWLNPDDGDPDHNEGY